MLKYIDFLTLGKKLNMRFIVFLFIVNFTISQCKSQEIKKNKLKELISICEKGHSDGLLVYKNNKLITDKHNSLLPLSGVQTDKQYILYAYN